MDDPAAQNREVILALTTTPPSVQQAAIDKYFTRDARFVHPFCRTIPGWESRAQISRIYRWYKILSPKIGLDVRSVAWDRETNIMYVGITQIFSIWAVPLHKCEVNLVTVLHIIRKNDKLGVSVSSEDESSLVQLDLNAAGGKWYIASQEDLYQTDQFAKFVLPPVGYLMVLWQCIAMLVCVVCSYIFAPVSWWEETRQVQFQPLETPPEWRDVK